MSKIEKRAIGIFGGSFDPPHKGHARITQIALKKIKLFRIFWIIAKKNPFKKKTKFSLKERMARSKKLMKKTKNVEILYIDDKAKSSRMINIINYFVKRKKNKKIDDIEEAKARP